MNKKQADTAPDNKKQPSPIDTKHLLSVVGGNATCMIYRKPSKTEYENDKQRRYCYSKVEDGSKLKPEE